MRGSHRVKQRYAKKLIQFGKNLKKIRDARGYTQEYMSFNSGISFSTYSTLERGKNNVTLATLYAIADTLKIDIKELFD